jgi:cysteinyl-tRNA synthetase
MSKSLRNFFTLRDLLGKGFQGREIRHLLLTAHYRETFNFTIEGLEGARAALGRIDECLGKLREAARGITAAPEPSLLERFAAAMDDDLNVSAAWGAIFEWVREVNRQLAANQLAPAQAAAALSAWQRVDSVFGLGAKPEAEAPAEIVALLERRQAARKAKDFAGADAIRAEMKVKGWLIEDTASGPKLKRA